MGLTKKIVYGLLLLGAFQFGRSCAYTSLDKRDIFKYIKNHEEERVDIYLYTRDYLMKTNPDLLESLIPDEQREQIARDYLKDPENIFEMGSKKVKEGSKIINDKVKRAYRELKK